VAAYIRCTTMLLFVLHETGIGWDEAAVIFGGLTAVTGALLMFLRRQEPAPEDASAEQSQPVDQAARHRR
jgi:hypothetical protein